MHTNGGNKFSLMGGWAFDRVRSSVIHDVDPWVKGSDWACSTERKPRGDPGPSGDNTAWKCINFSPDKLEDFVFFKWLS